jgi:thiol-disulfide isomerase/thioredoxin
MHRGVVSGLIGCALLVLAWRAAQAAAVHVSDRLPVVTVSDWHGDEVQLAPPRTGLLVIDFWASWCQPCRAALPELNALAQRYGADGLQVVAVNIDKARAPADAFLQTYVPAPVMTLLRDPGGGALARYGAAGMPALYVVDPHGVVRLVESGFTVEKLRTVEAAVADLLHGADAP